MTGSILWKSALTALVLAWSILSIIPTKDTPFRDYIEKKATVEKKEFAELLKRAEARVAASQDATFYVALKHILEAETLDLQKYLPKTRKFDVSDIKNRDKRNAVLLEELLKRSQAKVKLGLDLKGGVAFTFKIREGDFSSQGWERKEQLEQAIEIIRKRVDGLGVTEPVIRLKGDSHIEVQMPGISLRDNPEAVDSVSAPAKLEFSLVHRKANPRINPEPPLGYVAMVEESEDPETGEIIDLPYYIKKIPEMTGEIIDEAFVAPNDFGGYRVLLRFTDEGEKKFAEVTHRIAEENQRSHSVGQLAIILDGELYSTPTVREEIRGGAEITGRFTQREANELANVLNNPLKVGLEIDEMYEVGPSLAEDARNASFKAFLIGAVLVVIFMIAYYVWAGLVAVISVGINVVIVFGVLSSLGATITLPGVAALVLTIGMAVDANILIFERIREELEAGKQLRTSLFAGYEKALSTIVDANVTTLITAAILIWQGTGPVRGFGVTLFIGIAASMFCALLVSRFMLELMINFGLVKKMMTKRLFRVSGIAFLDYRKPALVSSWCLVLIGVGAALANYHNIFGIDFRGGEELTVSFERRLTSKEIVALAKENALGEVNPLYQSSFGEGKQSLKIQTEHGKGNALFAALQKIYPEAGLELMGKTTISASVGDEVKWSALRSIGLALIFILLYVAIRFEIGYGIGAVVATVHDILMSVGFYVLLGIMGIGSGQFTAPMVAAVLMIIGYSLNDTIVVFDRIREELTLNPGTNLRKIVNLAINRTLSRTILTSLTTLLATAALYLFGAGVVIDFALVFLIGIFTGTFSSIFIASPAFYWWHKGDRRHVEERRDILPKYEWESSSKPAR